MTGGMMDFSLVEATYLSKVLVKEKKLDTLPR